MLSAMSRLLRLIILFWRYMTIGIGNQKRPPDEAEPGG